MLIEKNRQRWLREWREQRKDDGLTEHQALKRDMQEAKDQAIHWQGKQAVLACIGEAMVEERLNQEAAS